MFIIKRDKPEKSPDGNGIEREIPEFHWHNNYTTIGHKYPIMRNYLAVRIQPPRKFMTMAIQDGKFSNLHAWCEFEDGHMNVSTWSMPLESARNYCEGTDFERLGIGVFKLYHELRAHQKSLNRKKRIALDAKT